MDVATASAKGLRVVGHHDLDGYGDGMQVLRQGNALYVGHNGPSGMGTSILDVSDPTQPQLVEQWPAPLNTHTHKVQVADGLLLVNNERFPYRPKTPLGPHTAGLAVYSLTDPLHPKKIGFWESGGKGVHRIVWEGGRYAHMSATPEGFSDRIWVVIDLEDPTSPTLAGKWWMPGQWEAGGEVATSSSSRSHFRVAAHHALLEGNYAYLGYDDANLVVLDVSDMTNPRHVGSLAWGGGATHTAMPLAGRDLLVVSDEQQYDGPHAPERRIHLVDISDPTMPRYLRTLPAPDAAYDLLPQRFGPHGFHENRAGSYRSNRLVFATYFNAGVRVYDLADPENPREVAHWVSATPPGSAAPQSNDLFVDSDGIIWVTDRGTGGVFALQPDDELAALMVESAY
ncbi:MAG: hypothetical protein JWP30_1982 [Homoserinimonas sp.]|nr:hypothetical protein [Homoserinimonas sp.]